MRKVRVLIVDDSTVVRRLLTTALEGVPDVEVIGTAANGKIALAKISQLNPDLITLDIEMPELDGLQTLVELRKTYPKLPVIMFSTLTQRGAASTLNALRLGATDYVTKPANVGSVTAAIQSINAELIPKIRALCPCAKAGPSKSLLPVAKRVTAKHPAVGPIGIIAIGVSTGGPNALTEIFRQMPATLCVPVVIVQHMPPVFTQHLAARLNDVSPLAVLEAKAGDVLRPGGVWLAPGDYHMALMRTSSGVTVRLHQGPHENSCRPAVDVLFRSVAEVYGSRALAVVLTGMGQDGLRGCESIREAGGWTIAQDEASSVVWGMPGAVAQAGLADDILPLNRIAGRLTQRAQTASSINSVLVGK